MKKINMYIIKNNFTYRICLGMIIIEQFGFSIQDLAEWYAVIMAEQME